MAVLVAALGLGAFALPWTDASSAPRVEPRASDDGADDLRGPCDEAENAGRPRCADTPEAPSTPAAPPAPTPTAAPAAPPAPTTTSATGSPIPTAGDAVARSFVAADAGTIAYSVDGAVLTLIDAAPAPGWLVEIERAGGTEIDVDFRSGSRRVQVDVEFEHGGVRERVRVRDDAGDDRTEIISGTDTHHDDSRHGRGSDD